MLTTPITPEEMASWLATSQILEQDARGVKVLLSNDGQIRKFFYAKTFPSSDFFWPYAKRFVNNARKLEALAVFAPRICTLRPLPAQRCYVVQYPLLAGMDLRAASEASSLTVLSRQLPQFLAQLHDKGIVFKGIHLGNLLLRPDHSFALIDIASMRFSHRPLTARARIKNLHHMLKNQEDRPLWHQIDLVEFVCHYNQQTSYVSLSPKQLTRSN